MIGGISQAIASTVNTAAGLWGASLDRDYARAASAADRDFQREVFQNQYQWKAADARAAGLHPLAVIGGGSYSASPSSVPFPSMSDALGKLGDGIGDAVAAFKSKDEMAAEKAIAEIRQGKQFQAAMNESTAKTEMYRAQAAESQARAQSYTRPMATGHEVIPGQIEASKYHDKFTRFRNPDGSLSGLKPSEEYQGIHDDKILLEYVPWAEGWSYEAKRSLSNLLNSIPQSQLDDILEGFSQIYPPAANSW